MTGDEGTLLYPLLLATQAKQRRLGLARVAKDNVALRWLRRLWKAMIIKAATLEGLSQNSDKADGRA